MGTSRSPCSGGRNGANQQTYSGRLDSFCQRSPAPVKGAPALHEVGTLETLASEAGLKPKEAGYVELAEEYPDLDTFLRGYLAAGPIVSAIRTLGEKPVRDALAEGVRPLMTASGGVRFEGRVPLPDRNQLTVFG